MIETIKNESAIQDLTFKNMLFKKFTIALCIMIIVLLCAYFPIRFMILQAHEGKIESKLNEVSLNLAQLVDQEEPNVKMSELCNVWFAEIQNEFEETEFIKESSISFYDLTREKIVAKSFEIPTIISDGAISWWREKSGNENEFPKISLNNEMMEFYKAYEKKGVYISEMYIVNSVIVPTKLVIVDKNQNEVKSCEVHLPTAYEDDVYDGLVKLDLIGNKISDPIYSVMSEYEFISTAAEHSEEPKQNLNANQTINETVESDRIGTLSYKKEFNKNVKMSTKTFTINEHTYQLDCAYNLSFWAGAWEYIVLIEVFGVLVCAIFAYLSSKEIKNIYE